MDSDPGGPKTCGSCGCPTVIFPVTDLSVVGVYDLLLLRDGELVRVAGGAQQPRLQLHLTSLHAHRPVLLSVLTETKIQLINEQNFTDEGNS
jgi:hypothetical protein